ncbi:hypothetical protein [uncultured Xanthomonas sp.]|uniref:hypothetical protein n=1 Tax=uncultured Xanthomonas sp. TaxID=152831 RepID=UPI0025EDFD60|nr:hypothetical protein [uncultured Xanthomonas sp.]
MRYLLNIGLIESALIADGRALSAAGAVETVRDLVGMLWDGNAAVAAHAVHTSDTEPTLVVEVRTTAPAIARMTMLADLIAVRLRQEAVAYAALLPSGAVAYGHLRGPMAARWGEFNPEFFLMLDGRRAAVPAEVAA